ncbi:MAG: hypothetical protein ACTSXG_01260 [Alphaproteobacteria bacterium]
MKVDINTKGVKVMKILMLFAVFAFSNIAFGMEGAIDGMFNGRVQAGKDIIYASNIDTVRLHTQNFIDFVRENRITIQQGNEKNFPNGHYGIRIDENFPNVSKANIENAEVYTIDGKKLFLVEWGKSEELHQIIRQYNQNQQPPQQMQQQQQYKQQPMQGYVGQGVPVVQQQAQQNQGAGISLSDIDLDKLPKSKEQLLQELNQQLTQETRKVMYDTRLGRVTSMIQNMEQLGAYAERAKLNKLKEWKENFEKNANKQAYLQNKEITDLEMDESIISYSAKAKGGKGTDLGQEKDICFNYAQEMLGLEQNPE